MYHRRCRLLWKGEQTLEMLRGRRVLLRGEATTTMRREGATRSLLSRLLQALRGALERDREAVGCEMLWLRPLITAASLFHRSLHPPPLLSAAFADGGDTSIATQSLGDTRLIYRKANSALPVITQCTGSNVAAVC